MNPEESIKAIPGIGKTGQIKNAVGPEIRLHCVGGRAIHPIHVNVPDAASPVD
jgi:hypothetical protein